MRTLSIILMLLACGCDRQRQNLQPLIAVAGTYGLTRQSAPVTPEGCTDGCKCNGTGIEKSGDGLHTGACRCPEGCPCKAKRTSSPVSCTTGSCGWPPRNIAR